MRLLTYNIQDNGRGREDAIYDVISHTQADVFLLQEVVDESLVRWLSKKLSMDYYFARGNSTRHLALLTHLPLVYCYGYHPFPLRNALLEAQIEYSPGHVLFLDGVHLSPSYHFSFEVLRLLEIKKILARIPNPKRYNTVLAGDLNAVAPGDPFNVEQLPLTLKLLIWSQGGLIPRNTITALRSAGFIDCYREKHPNMNGYTLPASDPHVRLDYFFIQSALRNAIRQCDVVTEPQAVRSASDHLPLLLDLCLEGE